VLDLTHEPLGTHVFGAFGQKKSCLFNSPSTSEIKNTDIHGPILWKMGGIVSGMLIPPTKNGGLGSSRSGQEVALFHWTGILRCYVKSFAFYFIAAKGAEDAQAYPTKSLARL